LTTSVGDAAEHGVLAVEPRTRVGGDDEELAAVRVRPRVRHGEGAAHDELPVELVLERIARPAGARCRRIATLNHEVGDDAMERDAVVEALAGERHEVRDRLRGVGVEQLDGDRAAVRMQRRVGHGGEPSSPVG
jgi:hypothetical protein